MCNLSLNLVEQAALATLFLQQYTSQFSVFILQEGSN